MNRCVSFNYKLHCDSQKGKPSSSWWKRTISQKRYECTIRMYRQTAESFFLIYLDIECAIARPKVSCYFCVSIKIMQFASAPFILCVVQLQLLYLPLPAPTETEGKLWCIHTFRKILQNCVKKLDYPNTVARLQLRKTPIKPNFQPLRVWTMTNFFTQTPKNGL